MPDTPPDPGALLRQMLGQWEQFANQVGGEVLKSDEFARTLHGANTAALAAQAALRGSMERGLAAAQLPSRGELEDIAARLSRVEASLARIEGLLTGLAGGPTTTADRPRPSRTRKPPAS